MTTMISTADALAEVRRWYDAQVDAVARAWEPRFRHRQYRPDTEEDDWETLSPPRLELEDALARLPMFQDDAVGCLVLAVSPQNYEDAQPITGQASTVMALDVLARAEALGYFREPCSEGLRFPDLPAAGLLSDDFRKAEEEAETAQNCAYLVNRFPDSYSAEKRADCAARLEAAQKRLAAVRAGEIPAFTEAQKRAQHVERRRAIVAAYRARLEAAGVDATWVEVERAGASDAREAA
ncbi:hypothetical protein [Anaeromyxobacter dehalogenans]|uniref:Uncharacterized protein n=1 Tax=Anaeromyxobacter dehalogenans (strain 2CP-C) TaxID=290397 RepID=Q2IIU7_ANADE|nr:hypothetical protein [Anaeromyxobacter dehalogenans]ABC81576.1 hypothetical protein Adeh_1803 [Anaeromyxobacter dehalogenans 2CP-C]